MARAGSCTTRTLSKCLLTHSHLRLLVRRATLAPKGYNDHSADFTIYVSHMKSGSAGTGLGSNGDRRNIEANSIRDDAFTLNDGLNGATSNEVAHVVYAGDYNWGGATETAYQT